MTDQQRKSQQIAPILDQLGRQFIALTGSSHFVALESGLQFNVGSGAKDGIGKVRIILEPSDTYRLDEQDKQDEQQPEELGMTLTDWYQAGQRQDALLTMAEWEHALREYRRVQ